MSTKAEKQGNTVNVTYLTGTGQRTSQGKVTKAHDDGTVDVTIPRAEGKPIGIEHVPHGAEGSSPPCYSPLPVKAAEEEPPPEKPEHARRS